MGYSCINEPWGYCRRRPDPIDGRQPGQLVNTEGKAIYEDVYTSPCVNDWHTCSAYQAWAQECERLGLLPEPEPQAS